MLTRVLVVLPLYGGSLPVGRYCAAALRDNGCLVEVFEAPAFFGSFEALKGLQVRRERLDYLENSYLALVGEAVLAQVERFAPDLVLAMAQAPLSRKTLARLKHDGVPTAMWFVEDYRLFVYWRSFATCYDFFAVIQREPFLRELADLGVRNALYLPLAALPELHRPLEGEALSAADRQRFGADVSFMGAGYPNRRRAFRELTGYDFKIWGTEWDDDAFLEAHLRMKGERISPEDAVRIFNAAKINLNLHSGIKAEPAVTRGDFINPRTFEIACCGAFQLVDERTLLPELFAEDEIGSFSTLEDLKNKLDYYLQRPEEREAIAERGRARVLKEHTYQARMKTLLDFVAGRLPDWPAMRPYTGWGEDLEPELCTRLEALMETLQLPAGADFETVIAALRGRSGKLSSLESALLFLDEWKKQYAKA
ncbi:MAG: glycosyltransferase [Deltaproteobacteria bacterium]|jgi:spore maturation protein CgeB|nr:glycosyltransferase [Deltaproteobacteria bacterium]